MRKADALKLWAEARAQAGEFMSTLETKGIVASTPVPDSDEEKAKVVLHELTVLALGPTERRAKLRAMRLVLAYTKEKPILRTETPLTAEGWLASVQRPLPPHQQPSTRS